MDEIKMTGTKYHTIKLTEKQFEQYSAAIQCIENLSISPIFYNSVRTINPSLKATDDQIKKELVDPLSKSLSKSVTNEKRPGTKRETNFNKMGLLEGTVKFIAEEVKKHEDITKYLQDDTKISSTQLKLLFKRFLILQKRTIAGGYRVDNIFVNEFSKEAIEKLQKEEIIHDLDDKFYLVPEKKLTSFSMRLSIVLCAKYAA